MESAQNETWYKTYKTLNESYTKTKNITPVLFLQKKVIWKKRSFFNDFINKKTV